MAAAEETDSAELILIIQFFQSPLEEELREYGRRKNKTLVVP